MKMKINSDRLNRSDIVSAKLDYKEDDWIRFVVIFNTVKTIVVHWDWIFYEGLICGDEYDQDDDGSYGIFEMWNEKYSDTVKDDVIELLQEQNEYEILSRIWKLAPMIVKEEYKKRHEKQIDIIDKSFYAGPPIFK